MRKLLPLLAALLLAGCTQIIQPPGANVHVYNSAWDKVAEATVNASRALGSAQTLEEYIASYNATHTDDQLFLVEGEEVPIQEAPDAPAFIVNAATLEVYWSDTVERADLRDRRELWRLSVETMADPDTGQHVPCTLYVDNVPPEPPIIIPPTPRLWVALINYTTQEVFYSEQFPTEAEAVSRYNVLCLQRDLNERDLGGDWEAYIGTVEYTWTTLN